MIFETVDQLIDALADVEKDEIICSGGRGFKKTESLDLVRQLAEVTGGHFCGLKRCSVHGMGRRGRSGRPDRQEGCTGYLLRMRHLRHESASGRHEGIIGDRSHQQES